MDTHDPPSQYDVIVIGAGQAGLSTGYHLRRRGLSFVLLDAGQRIGDAWRRRWHSLKLFTPARFDGLDGMPFPAPAFSFPTKDEMAGYLEAYARRFELPVRMQTRVDRLSREGHQYVVSAGTRQFRAPHVVVAMSSFQVPRIPAFARDLDPRIVQIHSLEYQHPGQLRDGDVLIVGAGNSGAEIAMELARSHRTTIAGRDTGHVPFRIDSAAARVLIPFVFRVLFHRILTVRTPIGRKVRVKALSQGGPLIRVKPVDLAAAGIDRAPRMAAVRDGRPLLEDGRVVDAANVIWCTGFSPGFDWIDLPVFDDQGAPRHDGGIATGEPGLYFVGLHFEYAMSSTMIHGVGRDADRIVRAIASRAARPDAALKSRATYVEAGSTRT